MNATSEGYGLGWLPDYPDFRDHTPEKGKAPQGEDKDVPMLLDQLGVAKPAAAEQLPSSVDLRAGFSPIENQLHLGSCTANAGVGILEYFERQAFGRHIDASRLFLYKATRTLMGQTGDTGAFLRTTMQALVAFGAPPEQYWPYTDDPAKFDIDPIPFCYAFGQDYKTIQYYRLDPPGTTADELLLRLKTNLAAKLPAMFGFTVYSSYSQADKNHGEFPYPVAGERRVGGHAVVAAGYDDARQIANAPNPGAVRIRNSWGTDWGEGGYGWLAYDYLRAGLATDWWSLIKADYIDSTAFGLGG